jgi:hypothetical protein
VYNRRVCSLFFYIVISRRNRISYFKKMAQSSLRQDSCSYMEQLRRSTGPGMYMLSTPANDCAPCGQDIPADPYLRVQAWGPGFCPVGENVDVGSELRGLNYRNSKCSTDQYLPSKYTAPTPCRPSGTQGARSCMAPTEDTRLSNPPCTLRGTGWNRWEWLCEDPQERALIPFEWNTSYRIVAKDNHQPCIPKFIDESMFQPTVAAAGAVGGAVASKGPETIHDWKPPAGCGAAAPGTPYMPTWRSCKEIAQM